MGRFLHDGGGVTVLGALPLAPSKSVRALQSGSVIVEPTRWLYPNQVTAL
jgi:hypothetical protein